MSSPNLIIRLNHDILRHIFSLNTLSDALFTVDPLHESWSDYYRIERGAGAALVTARHTSQVCLHWRSIVLSHPLIWANSINMDHLKQSKDSWRDEILRRTQQAPLSVLYQDGGRWHDGVARFFRLLVQNDWERLRRVLIHPSNGIDSIFLSPQIPRSLPHSINIFNVKYHTGLLKYDSGQYALLSFPEDRSLSTLHTLRLTKFKFVQSIPAGRLQHLYLYDCYLYPTFVKTLKNLSSLQTLHISDPAQDKGQANAMEWPMIEMPHLKLLNLFGTIGIIGNFLYSIIPHQDCVVWVQADQLSLPFPSAATQMRIESGTTKYFKHILAGELMYMEISGLWVRIGNGIHPATPPSSIGMGSMTCPCETTLDGRGAFTYRRSSNISDLLVEIMPLLFIDELTRIKRLQLHILVSLTDATQTIWNSISVLLGRLFAELLRSVTEVHCYHWTLSSLSIIQQRRSLSQSHYPETLFPSLETAFISDPWDIHDSRWLSQRKRYMNEKQNAMTKFLEIRRGLSSKPQDVVFVENNSTVPD